MSYRETKENNTGNQRANAQSNTNSISVVHQDRPLDRRRIELNEFQRGSPPNLPTNVPQPQRHSNQGHLHVYQSMVYEQHGRNFLRRSIEDYDNNMILRSSARPAAEINGPVLIEPSISQNTNNIRSSSNLIFDHIKRDCRATIQDDYDNYGRLLAPEIYRDYNSDGLQRHRSQNASLRHSLPNNNTRPLNVSQPTERDQSATGILDDSGQRPQGIRDKRHSIPMNSMPYENQTEADNVDLHRQHNSTRPIEINDNECTIQPQFHIDIRPVSHQPSRSRRHSNEARFVHKVPQRHVPLTAEECCRRNTINADHALPQNIRPIMRNTRKLSNCHLPPVVCSPTKATQPAPVIHIHSDQRQMTPKIRSRRESRQLMDLHSQENQSLASHVPHISQYTHTRTIERDDNNQRSFNNNMPVPPVPQYTYNLTNHDTRNTMNRFHPYGNHIAVDHSQNKIKCVTAAVNHSDQLSQHLDEEPSLLDISLPQHSKKSRAPEIITGNAINLNTQTENVSIRNTNNKSLNSTECLMDTPHSPNHEQFSDNEQSLHQSDEVEVSSTSLNKIHNTQHSTPNVCYTKNNATNAVQESQISTINRVTAKNAFMLQMKDLFYKLDATVTKTDAMMNSVQSKMVEFNELFKNIADFISSKREPINNNTLTLQESEEKLNKKSDKQNSSKNNNKCNDSDENSDERHFQSVKKRRSALKPASAKPKLDLPPEYDPSDHEYMWTLKHRQAGPGLKELLPSTGVYVDAIELTECLQKSNSCKALARMLMETIFTENALKVCSLTGVLARTPEPRVQRPGLNQHARIVILTFVEEHGIRQKWKAIDTASITSSMRNKLQEMRNRDNK